MSQKPHFLLISYPAQGHINPALQLGKRLVSTGALVTLVTAVTPNRPATIKDATIVDGLSFHFFDVDLKKGDDDQQHFFTEFQRRSSEVLSDLVAGKEKEGSPFTCIIYSLFLHCGAEVARENNLPSAFLWSQPATVFNVYYYFFNGYGDMIINSKNSSDSINLPGVGIPLSIRDLPSFILPSNEYSSTIIKAFETQMEKLCEETNPIVLMNTFDTLEPVALNSIAGVKTISIGPLIPSAFLDGKDRSDTSFGGDMFKSPKKETYTAWLDSKPDNSVVYVSFGSISVLSGRQQYELVRGLLDCNRPFIWVVRETKSNGEDENGNKMIMSCRGKLEKRGIIVSWCSQIEVLSHRSVGCFLTHCGWNSSLESLLCGVPVVAFPQWSDQLTNAKLIEDVWKIGVRVRVITSNDDENENDNGLVSREEIKRCLEKVMGIEGEDLRKNAEKFRRLGKDAMIEDGSSDKNLKSFVELCCAK